MDTWALKDRLLEAAHRLKRVHFSRLLGDSVSQGEFFALETICRVQEGESGICVSDLARHLRILPPAMSRTLHVLEHKGLIRREVDRGDRRNTRVLLTAEGRALRQCMAARMDEFSCRVVARMGEEEAERLIALWNHLSDIMEEELSQMLQNK